MGNDTGNLDESDSDLLGQGPPTPEEEEERIRQELEAEKMEISISTKERAERLSHMLYVYAREHPELGYRQGMHGILSYVLLVLEMDIAVQEMHRRKKDFMVPDHHVEATPFNPAASFIASPASLLLDDDNSSYGSTAQRRHSVCGGTAGVDSSGNVVVVQLLDPNYILHDAFSLFECIMMAMAPAYDGIPSGDEVTAAMLELAKEERGESPMEAMTSSFVSKIQYVARDEELYGHVLCMHVPPQLYFAKWVRLRF